MKKRITAFALVLIMCLTMFPAVVMAEDATTTPIYVTGVDEEREPTGFSFDVNEAIKDGETPVIGAYLISGNVAQPYYTVSSDFSNAAAIIDNVRIALQGDGRLRTEDMYIFGGGGLTAGKVTLTPVANNTISDNTSVAAIMEALSAAGCNEFNITGTLADDSNNPIELRVSTVHAINLSLPTNSKLIVEKSLTSEGAVMASQDAMLTICGGAAVSGITLYHEDCTNIWTDFSHDESFIFLETDDQSNPVNKWVHFVENNPGNPDDPHDFDFWVDYDDRNYAKVERTEEAPAYVYPPGWSNSYQQAEHFNKQGQDYDTLNFTLVPPDDGGTYSPIVEIEVYDAHEEPGDPEPVPVGNTILSSIGDVPAINVSSNQFSYIPTTDAGFVVRVFWSQAEYDFAHIWGKYCVKFSWEGNGNVTVSGGNQVTNGNRTKVAWDEDPGDVEFTVTPAEGENVLEAVWIEQESGGEGDYNALNNQESAFTSDGAFKLTVSSAAFCDEWDNYFVNMGFFFTGWDQQLGPEAPAIEVFYDGMFEGEGQDAHQTAFVQFSGCDYRGKEVAPGERTEFHFNPEAERNENDFLFVLTPPDPDKVPIVEVEVFDGSEFIDNSRYQSWLKQEDPLAPKCYPLAVNKGEGTYNFTMPALNYSAPGYIASMTVTVFWDEWDQFNRFGYNPNEEIQLNCRVMHGDLYGTSIDVPCCTYFDEETSWTAIKINVPKNTDSFDVTFINKQDCEFDKLVFDDAQYVELTTKEAVSGIGYTWAAADFEKELNVFFKSVGGQEPGPGPEPQGGVNWDALESALENYVFAYGGSTLTSAQAADLVCKELSERRIGDGLDYSLGEALGKNAEALAEYIDVQGNPMNEGAAFDANQDNKINKPYYSLLIHITDVDPETDGDQTFDVTNNLYVLDTDRDIIVESKKGGNAQYEIIALSNEAFGTTVKYIDADSITNICGNAVMCNSINAGGEDVFAYHVTQEHAGGINTFPIGSRLALTLEEDTARIVCGQDAAPWNFENTEIYSLSGTETTPVQASIFYGAGSINLSKETGSKAITDVQVCNLAPSAVEYSSESGILIFRTDYDVITIKISYEGGKEAYITLNRVGLVIDETTVDKESDVKSGDRFSDEDKAACTGDSFNVWHGTDQTVRYAAAGIEKAVTATFYYSDTTEVVRGGNDKWYIDAEGSGTAYDTKAEAVAAHYTEQLNDICLFVTITKNDGSVIRKTLATSDAITMSGEAVNNAGFLSDSDNAPGYAGQGNNHFYDEFVLWSGSQAEYAQIKSISVIAYRDSDSDYFRGVGVGSGNGVLWEKAN